MTAAVYPGSAAERTHWIVSQRGARNPVKVEEPYAFLVEQERMASGKVANVATIFLTNRECPWKCVMCDLWRNTITGPTPPGAVPKQIEFALTRLPSATVIKLYNSGSFFDAAAIPQADWKEIAALCSPFEHVIVESHPRLVTRAVLEFASLLHGSLEVAMGLETCEPHALEALNKGLTLSDYQAAAAFLREHGLPIRTFLLVHPPFIAANDQEYWLHQSIQFAFAEGASVVSLIPLRVGNGTLAGTIQLNLGSAPVSGAPVGVTPTGQNGETASPDGERVPAPDFSARRRKRPARRVRSQDELNRSGLELLGVNEPRLLQLEEAQEFGVSLKFGRVFADTWDLQRYSQCPNCFNARARRIGAINLSQAVEPRVPCPDCGGCDG